MYEYNYVTQGMVLIKQQYTYQFVKRFTNFIFNRFNNIVYSTELHAKLFYLRLHVCNIVVDSPLKPN